jgi:poly(3-hydroxybutyrate) depolymerase
MDGINGNEIWYYKTDNWGHWWPIYKPEKPDYDPGINASEVIWEFFESHPKQ